MTRCYSEAYAEIMSRQPDQVIYIEWQDRHPSVDTKQNITKYENTVGLQIIS